MSADERTLGERVAVWVERHENLLRFKDVTRPEREADALLREQQAEIERLGDVAEHWRGQFNYQKSEYTEAAMRIDSLRRDLEAARVDAERYRWLRDEGYVSPKRTSYMRIGFGYSAHELDAAIDLARARGEG